MWIPCVSYSDKSLQFIAKPKISIKRVNCDAENFFSVADTDVCVCVLGGGGGEWGVGGVEWGGGGGGLRQCGPRLLWSCKSRPQIKMAGQGGLTDSMYPEFPFPASGSAND